MSAGHITHPFSFPHLYPEEYPNFLSFLNSNDVKVEIQIRNSHNGKVLKSWPLKQNTYCSTDPDLFVGHLEDDASLDRWWKDNHEKIGSSPRFELELTDQPVLPQTQVDILGHDFSLDDKSESILLPTSLDGSVIRSNNKKFYIQTEHPSIMVRYNYISL